MNHKNHTGHGLRWMEALAREQISASKSRDSTVVQDEEITQPGTTKAK